MQFVTSHLLDYAHEFGDEAAIDALDRVTSCVRRVGGRRGAGRLRGSFMVNRAFRAYRDGDLAKVPRLVARAIANDPAHLTNRGVAAIFARSLVGSGRTSNRDS
jgi:plasmid stabilization system protein ParE